MYRQLVSQFLVESAWMVFLVILPNLGILRLDAEGNLRRG